MEKIDFTKSPEKVDSLIGLMGVTIERARELSDEQGDLLKDFCNNASDEEIGNINPVEMLRKFLVGCGKSAEEQILIAYGYGATQDSVEKIITIEAIRRDIYKANT